MCKQSLFFALTLAVLCFPGQVYAQFTDPRICDNTPVGINQFELDYAYARANASIDTSQVIAGAKLNLNAATTLTTRAISASFTAWHGWKPVFHSPASTAR